MSVKRYKKDDQVSYSLGITLTIELLKNKSKYCNKIYLSPSYEKKEAYKEIEEICLKNRIPIETNSKVFNILSEKENCFIIGEFSKFSCVLEDENHIVLVNPSNMGNLGTILRSALGFGIKNIAIISPACDIFDPKVIRSSMGAIFSLNFAYFSTFDEYKEKYSSHHFYPFMLQSSKKIYDVSFEEKYSLVFGNEATGLQKEFLTIGQNVIIPHGKAIDSLNLPIAVSIALYEVTKNNKF